MLFRERVRNGIEGVDTRRLLNESNLDLDCYIN